MLISILLQRYGRYDDQGAPSGGDLFDLAIGFVVLALGVAFVLFAFYGLVAFFSSISGADNRVRERKRKEKVMESGYVEWINGGREELLSYDEAKKINEAKKIK